MRIVMRYSAVVIATVVTWTGVLAVPAEAQTIDQQQLVYNGGLSARTLPGYTVWQSFTAGLTGTLTEIDMGFFNNMSGDGTLTIYSGQGTAGTILETLDVPVVGITQPGATWDDWSVSVPIQAGLQYTFELTPNPQTLPDPYGVCVGSNNPYPVSRGVFGGEYTGGSSYIDTGFDAVFQTKVAQTPEPSTAALLGVAAIGLLGYIWRRRRAARG